MNFVDNGKNHQSSLKRSEAGSKDALGGLIRVAGLLGDRPQGWTKDTVVLQARDEELNQPSGRGWR